MTRELSDGEIMELAEYHGINDWLYETSVTDFARAILKKASFTCNGSCGEYECKENQSNCKRINK